MRTLEGEESSHVIGDLLRVRRRCPARKPPTAFRLTIHDTAREFLLAVEGRVTLAAAAELEQCWRTAASSVNGRPFVIDVYGVASLDDGATRVLGRLLQQGAVLGAARPEIAHAISAILGESVVPKGANLKMSFPEILRCLFYRLRTLAGFVRATDSCVGGIF